MRSIRIAGVGLLLFAAVSAGSLLAAQGKPSTSSKTVSGPIAKPLLPAVVLYDQTAGASQNTTSQNFEAAFDTFDNQAADDFVVPALHQWSIDTLFAPGVYFNGTGPATSINVTFYADASPFPGAAIPACTYSAVPMVDSPAGTFTVTLSPACVLAAGTYWVSAQANQDFGTAGQWAWTTVTGTVGSPSAWQNPGDGFGTGCTTWGLRTTCLGQTDPDIAFSLSGTDVVTPVELQRLDIQ